MLEPGATLLLYTDGLVERRGVSLTIGLDRLSREATAAPPEPAHPATTVASARDGALELLWLLKTFLEDDHIPDDVALLRCAQPSPPRASSSSACPRRPATS